MVLGGRAFGSPPGSAGATASAGGVATVGTTLQALSAVLVPTSAAPAFRVDLAVGAPRSAPAPGWQADPAPASLHAVASFAFAKAGAPGVCLYGPVSFAALMAYGLAKPVGAGDPLFAAGTLASASKAVNVTGIVVGCAADLRAPAVSGASSAMHGLLNEAVLPGTPEHPAGATPALGSYFHIAVIRGNATVAELLRTPASELVVESVRLVDPHLSVPAAFSLSVFPVVELEEVPAASHRIAVGVIGAAVTVGGLLVVVLLVQLCRRLHRKRAGANSNYAAVSDPSATDARSLARPAVATGSTYEDDKGDARA